MFDLLNDPKYRKSVIKTLEDKNLINFWKNEIGKAGDMQKVKMAAGITAKIGRFLFSASARQILEQPNVQQHHNLSLRNEVNFHHEYLQRRLRFLD